MGNTDHFFCVSVSVSMKESQGNPNNGAGVRGLGGRGAGGVSQVGALLARGRFLPRRTYRVLP